MALYFFPDYALLDFVIYFLLFVIVLREFFSKTFDREDYFTVMLYLVISFCFSFSIIVWEIEHYFFISSYGKLILILTFIYIFIKVRNFFQEAQ